MAEVTSPWATASPYDNETYVKSLQSSREDVSRQVQNALDEIARRREVALGQLRLAAGEQGNIFNATEKDYRGSLADLASNLGQYGGLFSNLSAYDPSAFVGALGQLRGGFEQANTALGSGFDEQKIQRDARAGAIQTELFRDLDAQRASYIAQREAEDRAREEAARQAEAARQFEIEQAQMSLADFGGGGGYDFGGIYTPPATTAPPATGKIASAPMPKANPPASYAGVLPQYQAPGYTAPADATPGYKKMVETNARKNLYSGLSRLYRGQ